MSYSLLLLVAVFLLATLLVWLFRHYALHTGLLDTPNERSSHTIETARGGGVVFVLLWLVMALVMLWADIPAGEELWAVLPGAVLIAAVGYLDDRHTLAARWRLVAQLAAAAIYLFLSNGLSQIDLGFALLQLEPWLGSGLGLLALIWSVNLFNFMDGTDGIAGSEAIFVLGLGGLFLWQSGGTDLALSAWLLAAAVGGFLVWNWPRAKIFMGDAGSGFLGFMIAVYALRGEALYGTPVILWLMLYSVFWFDATVTLLRRMLAGESWTVPHRAHAYQRLHHGLGWSHQRILWSVVGINSAVAVLTYVAYITHAYMLAMAGIIALLAVCYLGVERNAAMYPRY